MDGRGVLYVVTGEERYAQAALTSARSVRRAMPDLPIALATAQKVNGPFDYHIPITETAGFRAKIVASALTPFAQTLFLDVDTYVLGDLGAVFELLDRFDMAFAHAPNRFTMPLADVPVSFPEFNTGVIAYSDTEASRAMLAGWLGEYDALLAATSQDQDQPSFRRAAYRAPGLRIATLTPEFNQRFLMAGYYNQPPVILHGWPDRWAGESDFHKTAAAMRAPLEAGAPYAVFAGRRVYDNRGDRSTGFAVPWHRLRRVVRSGRLLVARLRGA